jgi:hypothetical protein
MGINAGRLISVLVLGSVLSNARADLAGSTVNGANLVFSSVSNVTWTADANLLGTMESQYAAAHGGDDSGLIATIINASVYMGQAGVIADTPNSNDNPVVNSGSYALDAAYDFRGNGLVSWFGAQAFVNYLNTIDYGGSNQWRLPTLTAANPQFGFNQLSGELGQLFYSELGGVAGGAMPGNAVFSNQQTDGGAGYWYGSENATSPEQAWFLGTDVGYQDYDLKGSYYYAWAVSPGQISSVPLPASSWLFVSGILGLLRIRRNNSV